MRCDEMQDSLALKALGEPVAASVEAHLGSCRRCRAALAEMREALAEMAKGLPSEPPRPEVWAGIRERIRAESARPARTAAVSLRWTAAVLTVALMLSLAGWWRTAAALRGAEQRAAALQAQMEASVRLWSDGRMNRTLAMRLQPLEEGAAPDARGGCAVYRGEDGDSLLVVWAENLPATTGSEAYQVWLNRAGRRWSAGHLVLDREGNGILFARAEDPEFDSLGITREPKPAMPDPSGPRVLVSSP